MIKRDHSFQFKITLQGLRPPIWRRIVVPSSYTFWDLHVAIQDAMGWLDYHLHLFRIRNPTNGVRVEIGIPSGEQFWDEPEPLCGWAVPIASYFTLSNRRATYLYDFGDGWQHSVVLEEIVPLEGSMTLPVCLAGRRRCPPEDCGGIGGYERFLEILGDTSHEEHEDMLVWAGGSFDSGQFERAAIQFDDPYERWQLAFESDPREFETNGLGVGVDQRVPVAMSLEDRQLITEPTAVDGELVMSNMTPQASSFWDSLPDREKTLFLNNVWCSACCTSRTIMRYKGRIEDGSLILEGECGTCGAAVARLVEGS